ncbi:hypothetical protein OPV22_034055 [Ensete ventricosum]|uniref:Uncharacterized protein n=1 Tax=Ensete ventricosum TaxID=4639 RepID=A0AAV8Q3P5_ENSVE|nr:hypothetical protein OPV22_034055 [Ensete ventricosum]
MGKRTQQIAPPDGQPNGDDGRDGAQHQSAEQAVGDIDSLERKEPDHGAAEAGERGTSDDQKAKGAVRRRDSFREGCCAARP